MQKVLLTIDAGVGYFLIHLQSSYRVPCLANATYSVPGLESITLLPSYITVFTATVSDKKQGTLSTLASVRSIKANKKPDRADRAGRERPVFGRAEELVFYVLSAKMSCAGRFQTDPAHAITSKHKSHL